MTIHTQLFLALALNSLACLGVHCVTREGMVFENVRTHLHTITWQFIHWLLKVTNSKKSYYFHAQEITDYLFKPLFDCPPCMASVWGFLGWFYLTPGLALLPYLLVLCGVNALVSKLYYYGD